MNRKINSFVIIRIIFILNFVLLALITRCKLFDLSAPTWDVHFAIPLINKTYTMDQLIVDEVDLVVNDDGLVAYTLTGEIDTTEIGDHLKMDALKNPLFFYVDENFNSSTQNGIAQLPEKYQIIEAEILSGELYIETHNPTRYAIDSKYKFDDFGNFNIPDIRIDPQDDQGHGPFPLNGVILTTDPQDHRSVRYEITTQKIGEWPNGNRSGNIEVTIRIENVIFKRIEGILNQVEVPLDTVETEMNLPEQLEGIQFGPLTLQLHIQNGADVNAEVDIRFEAINKDEQVKTITAGGLIEGNAESIIEIDGFETLINHYPKQLVFHGNLVLGDGVSESVVHYDDRIYGSYFSEIPLVFNLMNNVTETPPDTIEMEEETRDAIRDNLLEAHLMVETFNHLPIGATIEIIFAAESQNVYSPNADVVKVLQLNSGETPQGQQGTINNSLPVVGEGESQLDFGLTKEELNVFDRERLYFGTRITFEDTPGFVQVSPDDYVKLSAWIDATLHAEVPEEEDEEGGES